MGKRKKGNKANKKLKKEENKIIPIKKEKKEKKLKNIIIDNQGKINDLNNIYLKSVKKKVAISYKRLKENHTKTIENKDINSLSLENLKIIASNFDIDPLINFRLLSLLKVKNISEYNKYITKYKYTLNYTDAKKLNCFKDNIEEIKKQCLINFGEKIDNIKSLSKLKLFNFLFFIMKFEYDGKKFYEQYKDIEHEIKETIKIYQNEVEIMFKVPINFGNYELKYYTFLGLFIKYFHDKIILKKDKKENIEQNENDIYFDWDKNTNGEIEEIDMSKLEEKKNDLKKFIDKYIKENFWVNGNNNMGIEKCKNKEKNDIISVKEENDNNSDDLSERIMVSRFIQKHVQNLKIYKSELYYLFKQNDEKTIRDIEFIYYSLLFRDNDPINEIYEEYDSYPNCLYNDPTKKNEKFHNIFQLFTNEIIRNSINQNELVFANLDFYLPERKDNPFCNKAKYFKYPQNLEKNIYQENLNTKKFFRNFLKDIFQSPLLEEIFYLTPEFKDFKYPLKDDEILNEMIDNTIFIPFGNRISYGYTQKQFTKVYISNNLFHTKYSKNDISEIIIKLSFTLNTLIHELLKHYMKWLLFYNSFRYKDNKKLDNDLEGYLQESFFIDNIRKIYFPNKEVIFKPILEGGYRAEIYLYGYILHKLSFNGAIKMYKKFPWNLSVLEHLKQFNKNNKPINKVEFVKIDDIKNNKELNDFIKNVFVQFCEFYDIDVVKIKYNKMISEKSKFDFIELDDEEKILIDYSVCLERNIARKPDTETDKRYLYLFDLIEDY